MSYTKEKMEIKEFDAIRIDIGPQNNLLVFGPNSVGITDELVRRWNCYEDLPEYLAEYLASSIDRLHKKGLPMDFTKEGLKPIFEQGIAADGG